MNLKLKDDKVSFFSKKKQNDPTFSKPFQQKLTKEEVPECSEK